MACVLREQGEGDPALVLLCGLGDPAAWWWTVPTPQEARPHWRGLDGETRPALAPALAQWTRVVAYDRAGVGDSPRPPHPYTWPDVYAELDGVLNTIQPSRPPILIGHSLGGMIASTYARRRPARVGGLVLLDPTPPPLTDPPPIPLPEPLALTPFGPEEVAPGALGDLPLLLIAPDHPASPDEAPGRTQEQLDARFHTRHARHLEWLTLSSRSRAVWVDHPGHYVHLERPEVVVGAIRAFWEELT